MDSRPDFVPPFAIKRVPSTSPPERWRVGLRGTSLLLWRDAVKIAEKHAKPSYRGNRLAVRLTVEQSTAHDAPIAYHVWPDPAEWQSALWYAQMQVQTGLFETAYVRGSAEQQYPNGPSAMWDLGGFERVTVEDVIRAVASAYGDGVAKGVSIEYLADTLLGPGRTKAMVRLVEYGLAEHVLFTGEPGRVYVTSAWRDRLDDLRRKWARKHAEAAAQEGAQ